MNCSLNVTVTKRENKAGFSTNFLSLKRPFEKLNFILVCKPRVNTLKLMPYALLKQNN